MIEDIIGGMVTKWRRIDVTAKGDAGAASGVSILGFVSELRHHL